MPMQIGEGFAGAGVNAAHVNTVLGSKDGPVGVAWATALASPSAGHAPFVAVVKPNVPLKPATLFVNKAAIAGDRHGALTWGAAQAGVAAGVLAALRNGAVAPEEANDLVLITAVWVNPDANEEEAVFTNNEAATLAALIAGHEDRPTVDDVLGAGAAENPFFRMPS